LPRDHPHRRSDSMAPAWPACSGARHADADASSRLTTPSARPLLVPISRGVCPNALILFAGPGHAGRLLFLVKSEIVVRFLPPLPHSYGACLPPPSPSRRINLVGRAERRSVVSYLACVSFVMLRCGWRGTNVLKPDLARCWTHSRIILSSFRKRHR